MIKQYNPANDSTLGSQLFILERNKPVLTAGAYLLPVQAPVTGPVRRFLQLSNSKAGKDPEANYLNGGLVNHGNQS